MTKPYIAQNEPYVYEVQEGKNYAWCSCGLSKTQPLCDNSHQGTEFKPYVFTAYKSTTMIFCGCKQTAAPPFCDGSHNMF